MVRIRKVNEKEEKRRRGAKTETGEGNVEKK